MIGNKIKILASIILGITILPFLVFASGTLLDSYGTGNADNVDSIATNGLTHYGECFTTPNDGISYKISSAKFYMSQDSGATANTVAILYHSTGTCGTNATPTGVAMATSTAITADTFPTYPTQALSEFLFDGTVSLSPNTDYFIVGHYDGSEPPSVYMAVDSSSPTFHGNKVSSNNNGGTWTASTLKATIFYVYGNPPATSSFVKPPDPILFE